MEVTNYTPPLSVNRHIPTIGTTPVISYDKSPLEYSKICHQEVINKKEYRRQAYLRWKRKD